MYQSFIAATVAGIADIAVGGAPVDILPRLAR